MTMFIRLVYLILGGIQIILAFLGFSSLPYIYQNHIPLIVISTTLLLLGSRLMYFALKE